MFGLYDINVKREISLTNENIYLNGANHPDRVMKEHDLVYIIEGSWEIYQNGRVFLLEPDDVIVLHAGQHHYGQQPCKPGTRTLFIHMNRAEEDCFYSSDLCGDSTPRLKINTVTHCQHNYSVKKLFYEIVSTFWSKTASRENKLSAQSQLLLCELYECKEDMAFSEIELIEKAIQIIHFNPQLFFTAGELAERLFVSDRTLRNKFNKIYGKTPYQYQIDTKLEKASILMLEYPKMPLKEIAANLGFCDEFHLSKTFKKKFGIPPSKFRKTKAGS